MKLEVDTSELKELAEEGSKIIFKSSAEQQLLALLDLRDRVEQAIEDAKAVIEKTALAYNPNFTAVYGSDVVAGYRHYGRKYKIDENYLDQLPEEFYKRSISYSAESKTVDKFLQAGGKLPLGISPTQRSKKITLKRRNEFDAEGEE